MRVPLRGVIASSSSWPVFIIIFANCIWGVAVGCSYCSGCWWTSKGWSDHHTREHPLSDPYPMGADLKSLLVKKAQAGVTAESKAILPTHVVDDFPEDESLSSTSTEEDEEDCSLCSFFPSAESPAFRRHSRGCRILIRGFPGSLSMYPSFCCWFWSS